MTYESEKEMITKRPDISKLVVGRLYKHLDSDAIVEYIGEASMPELHGEDVGVFRFVDGEGCIIATQYGYDRGEAFQPYGDSIEEELVE